MTTDDLQLGTAPLSHPENRRVAIVYANWNAAITYRLRDSAVNTLHAAGIPAENVECFDVPGTVELTFLAARLLQLDTYDAIIVIGCVIRGDTPHFDYVCQSVTHGVTELNLRGVCPVIFNVLTVDDYQQAVDRCGGPAGDKGKEAALTAVDMMKYRR